VLRDRSVLDAVLVNPSTARGERLVPGRADLSLDSRRLLVEIPAGFTEIQRDEPELAMAWRLHTREVFQAYLTRGYRVVDFFLSREAGRGQFLLAERVAEGTGT
jgi:predicted GNAT superfamily acetyltransferase